MAILKNCFRKRYEYNLAIKISRPWYFMLNTFRLLLPALIPSWRFFDTIAPSPRIEFTLLETADDTPTHWQEFCPRPTRLRFGDMLRRLFWNRRWNESLFLISCAERLIATPSEHSAHELAARISTGFACSAADIPAKPWLRFRLALVSREGTEMQRHIAYVSRAYSATESADS